MFDDASSPDIKRAVAALRAARARILELERARSEPIAVVGVGCRFPGGVDSPDAFWDLLLAGRDGLGPIPPERWDADAWYHPDPAVPGRSIVRRGGFLADVDRFDPDFFGLSEREAAQIDPQQRLLLEVSVEALERAGQSLDRLRGSRTGTFVGICASDFALGTMFSGDAERIDAHSGTGSAISMAAGRIAYSFGLEGPALTVDTACSSSLVAVHLACQALRAGECDLALAAGVSLMLSPLMTVFFSRLGVLSPSGQVRAFDASADGYLRSDGCGAVVLRRLSDALAARDPVLAVIRGSAVGQNGRGNGLTAPNGRAQEAVIQRALDSAGRRPDDVGYVEAFGAATPLGDRIELEALDRVFGRARTSPLDVGSVKTNLGHAEAAAGMASLIKAVLAVAHDRIPASLGWERPPPGLPWDAMRLRVPVEPAPWPAGDRCAGISGFGFSGTNVHVIVEEAPAPDTSAIGPVPVPIALSGRSEADLRERARRLLDDPALTTASLADIAYTLGARRSARPVRAAFVAADKTALEAGLRRVADGGGTIAVTTRAELVVGVAADARDDDDRAATAALVATLRSWGIAPDAAVGGAIDGLPRADACDVVIGVHAREGRLALADATGQITSASVAALWAALFLRGLQPQLDVPGARAVALSPSPFLRARHWAGASQLAAPSVASTSRATAVAPPSRDMLRDAPEAVRVELLQTYLRDLFARLLTVDPDRPDRPERPERIDVEADLSAQGMDSLVAVEAIGQMLLDLGVQVYPTELYEHASVAALARHLARPPGAGAAATPADHGAARAAIAAAFPDRPPCRSPSPRLPAPVFILSSPRAGSTLLRVMLAGHPQLFAPPELHLLLADDLDAWHQRLAPELLTLGLTQAWIGLGLSEADALRRVDAAVARRESTPAMYAALLERLGGRVLVDKSPSYGFDPVALARAEQWFEGARYIHLVRHPYAVIESFARLRMERLLGAPDAAPHVAGEQAWALSAERIGTFLDGVDPRRWLQLRYEDLVADPRQAMSRLCGFLDVPPHDALLEPYRGERMVPARDGRPSFLGDPGFSRHGRIDPTLGERWREATPPAPLQPETSSRARALGYALPEPATSRIEVALPDELRATGAPAAAPFGAVLLTGATGFLGAWLLADLLETTSAVVHVLVRAPTAEAGRERVRAALRGVGRASIDERRIRVVCGDLARARLGVSDAVWASLAADVDAVIHNGAVVHFGLGSRQLHAPNVGGTLEVLRLAAAGRVKPVLHVSTKGVFSPRAWPGDGSILEDAPLRPMDTHALGYQHTKWAAEQLVAAARERGIPTAVVRPGRIGGDLRSGVMPEDDLLVRFLRSCVELGAAPDVGGVVETMPVDVVSRAIVTLLDRPIWGRTFHLMHPTPLPLANAVERIVRAGHDQALLPYPAWRARLRDRVARGEPSALAPLVAMFGETPPERIDDRRFDAANTRAVLGDLAAPSVADQLDRTLRWLRDQGMVPA